MRFVLVTILLMGLTPLAGAQESEGGQTDMSSNWAHEDGFVVSSEKRSKAEQFLRDLGPEQTPKTPAPPAAASNANGAR